MSLAPNVSIFEMCQTGAKLREMFMNIVTRFSLIKIVCHHFPIDEHENNLDEKIGVF